MMITIRNSLLLLIPAVLADSVHRIYVGQNGLVYAPNSVTAAVGDQVEFHFNAGHTVTQGTYAEPCAPKDGGFNSGFVGSSGGPPFTITITDDQPIYFYCGVGSHCKNGMAGAINAPADASADDYASAARLSSGNAAQPIAVQGGTFAPATTPSSSSSTSAPDYGVYGPPPATNPGSVSSTSPVASVSSTSASSTAGDRSGTASRTSALISASTSSSSGGTETTGSMSPYLPPSPYGDNTGGSSPPFSGPNSTLGDGGAGPNATVVNGGAGPNGTSSGATNGPASFSNGTGTYSPSDAARTGSLPSASSAGGGGAYGGSDSGDSSTGVSGPGSFTGAASVLRSAMVLVGPALVLAVARFF